MGDDQYTDLADKIAETIEKSVGEVLIETGGGMLTRFNFIAEIIDRDSDRGWITAHSTNQNINDSYAMALWQAKDLEGRVNCIFRHQHE